MGYGEYGVCGVGGREAVTPRNKVGVEGETCTSALTYTLRLI